MYSGWHDEALELPRRRMQPDEEEGRQGSVSLLSEESRSLRVYATRLCLTHQTTISLPTAVKVLPRVGYRDYLGGEGLRGNEKITVHAGGGRWRNK